MKGVTETGEMKERSERGRGVVHTITNNKKLSIFTPLLVWQRVFMLKSGRSACIL